MSAKGAYTRPYRRNLIALGYERAAKYVLTAIKFTGCGGRRSVFVADDGGISVYAPSHPKVTEKPVRHFVGTYGSDVRIENLEDDLLGRLRELNEPASRANMTKTEWQRRFAQRLVDKAGIDPGSAAAYAKDGAGLEAMEHGHNVSAWPAPETAADTEMADWE